MWLKNTYVRYVFYLYFLEGLLWKIWKQVIVAESTGNEGGLGHMCLQSRLGSPSRELKVWCFRRDWMRDYGVQVK